MPGLKETGARWSAAGAGSGWSLCWFIVSPEVLDKAMVASVGRGFCQPQKLLLGDLGERAASRQH